MKTLLFTPLLILYAMTITPMVKGEEAKAYKIKYSRPHVKGAKFEVEIISEITTKRKESQNGVPAKKTESISTAIFLGTEETLAVSAGGNASKLQLTVKKFTMENEPNTDLLPPGHVVIGEYVNGEKKFTVNGQPVKQSIGNILLEMFSLGGAATDPSSDKTFGMDKPHAVGATWEIDMKAILSKMDADERAGIDEKESTGKMKFEKIENMEGMKVGTVSSTILFKVIRLKGLPANMELKNSTIEMLIDFFLPLDEKKPGMGQETSTTSTTNVIRTNADGGTTEITSITSIYLKDNRKPMN